MAIREWLRQAGAFLSGKTEDQSQRPDGGTSCYRPMQRKHRGRNREETAGSEEAGGISYIHTGFTNMNPPMDYSTPQTGYFNDSTDPAMMPRDNISYMPGAYAPDAGSSYTHVEHIMAMTGLKSCYEAIECMKNGETLIVTLDAIANEGENLRCQDMLAGAAFTLGCSVRMIQGGRLVLIAPEGVKILPEVVTPGMDRRESGYRAAPPMTPQVPEAAPMRRERRTSQHTAEWTAARNGDVRSYNPYTGSMPAAAGAYTNFGGYGY